MNHSPKCLERLTELRRIRIEFEMEFPNFCRACGATGWQTCRDSVPYGSTNVTMESSELCEHCIGLNCCPRCEQLGTYDETSNIFTCKCGYDSNDPTKCEGAPLAPDEYDDCICDALENSFAETYQN